MPKVSKQTAAKGGLMTAILGMIGNVVGIGIFFKNGTVFRLNGQDASTNANCWGVLVAWLISTLIVLFMAISFAEIASCKTKSGKAGIGPWAGEFCGHKFGRYSKLGYNLIFWPINTFAVMFFAGEALLECFAPLTKAGWTATGLTNGYNFGRGTTAYVFLIGALLFTIFMIVNYIRFKNMAKVGKAISYVKFAPIALVVLVGIIFGALNGGGIWVQNAANTSTEVVNATNNATATFSFIGVISCIPAILFSFEGYVAIDSFKNDLSNPDKQIPLGVVIGVIVIAVLYFAVTIGCITAGTGDVYSLMLKLFGTEGGKFYNEAAYKALTLIISIFIFICLIGCVNGMCRGGITSYQELCKDGSIFKGKSLYNKKPGNEYFAGAISFAIVIALWFVILFIPSVIWNTDAIADGSSTSMIVCLYVIYGGIVLCALINRFNRRIQISGDKNFKLIVKDEKIAGYNSKQLVEVKLLNKNYYIREVNQVEVKKNKIFPVAAVIGIIGCLFMIGYVAFFQFLSAPIMGGLSNPNDAAHCVAKSGWGMFVSSSCPGYHTLTNGETMAWFWAMTVFAAVSPILNDLFIKWWDKQNKNPLMWQKEIKGRIAK